MFVPFFMATALLTAGAEPVSDNCLDQNEARDVAQSEKLIQVGDAAKIARAKNPGEVVSAKLCRVDQRLMYVLAILARDGRVVRVPVDAQTRAIHQVR